jgi:sialic acid synthase SpsE
LTRREIYFLKDECDKIGIELLFSVFDLDRFKWAEEVNVKRHKIASGMVKDENKELIDAILNTGKETIISYGLFDKRFRDGIHEGQSNIENYLFNCPNTKHLYCVMEYPTSFDDLHLSKETFDNVFDGFSDHTVGISAALTAMALGAKIIEKHFTLDKTMDGPDHICSAEFSELAMICKIRDDIEKILYKSAS